MNEPDLVQGSWSAEDSTDLAWADSAEAAAAKSLSLQLKLDLGTPQVDDFAPYLTPDADLEDEISLLRSRVQKQVDRIQNLEKALDQSLISLEELRIQLVDQQFLENQLAATEDIANVQQRAITQLKQQLTQQQQALDIQQAQTQEQAQSFQELLNVMEQLAEGQQAQLSQLKGKILVDRLPSTLADPSTMVESSAAQLAALTQQLSDRQQTITQLETELERSHDELQQQAAVIENLQKQPAFPTAVAHDHTLDQELFTAHCKIQDLETQASKQATTQAILQHTCQELEQARDRYQTRATELELQTADMQEQILQQAQQSAEYETAVQHWKDRYVTSQDYLKRLKNLVEQSHLQPSQELTELLAAIQVSMEIPEPESSPTTINRTSKMDIPDFLARRHRYRVRS